MNHSRYSFALAVSLLCAGPALAAEKVYETTAPVPVARQMYGTAVLKDYLYLIGGNTISDEYTDSVMKAKINEDGTLEKWESTTPLPVSRSYINNTTLVLGDSLYVVQGLEGRSDEKFRTIVWAKQGESGELGDWQESFPCPGAGVSCSVAVAAQNAIHLIGGSVGGSTPTSSVWQAAVDPEGSVQAWSKGPELPTALWFHSAAKVADMVYVWGGLSASSNSSANLQIFASAVKEDGSLSEWRTLPTALEVGQYAGACAASGNFLLTFCPRYPGGQHSGDVWYSVVGADGPGKWVKREYDLPPKLYIGVANDSERGNVYLPGGRFDRDINLGMDSTVYFFPLKTGRKPPVREVDFAAPPSAAPSVVTMPVSNSVALSAPARGGLKAASKSIAGFFSYAAGQEIVGSHALPHVIYLHRGDPGEVGAQAAALSAFTAQPYFGRIVFMEADVASVSEAAPLYNVLNGPLWLFFDANGNKIVQKNSLLQQRELEAAIQLITP